MTANEIHRACIAAGHKLLVTVCPHCGTPYWRAWTKEQQAKKKATK